MASPTEIFLYLKSNAEYARRNAQEINRRIEKQKQEEISIVRATSSFCPYPKMQRTENPGSKVDTSRDPKIITPDNVRRAIAEGYDDPSILRSLMCMNNSILMVPEHENTIAKNLRIRDYIRHLRQIGKSSAYGYAMAADLDNNKGLFVVKSPRFIDEDDLIHEYFIGTFGTNTLRKYIPNFTYILGLFRCSPPFIADYSQLNPYQQEKYNPVALTYCQNNNSEKQVYYVLYENITNSISMRDFINTCTVPDFINVLVQVVLSLDLAYTQLNFTHYDLHTANVLIRKLDTPIYIPYPVDNKTLYLKTSYVANIIDYGFAHIEYNGKHYGHSFIENGVYPDRAHAMYDVFKFMFFCLLNCLYRTPDPRLIISDMHVTNMKNRDLFFNAKYLLPFFYPQIDINNVVKYLLSIQPVYPYYKGSNLIRPISFYNYIEKTFSSTVKSFITTQPTGFPIYGCVNKIDTSGKTMCLTIEQALNKYTTDAKTYISNPYIFYDLIVRYYDGSKRSIWNKDIQNLIELARPYAHQMMEKLVHDRSRYINELNQLLPLEIIVLIHNREGLYNDVFVGEYNKYLIKFIKIIDLLTLTYNIQKLMNEIVMLFPELTNQKVPRLNVTYHTLLIDYFKIINKYKYDINIIINTLYSDLAYIRSLPPDQVNYILKYVPNARWLFDNFPTVASAIDVIP